MRIKLLSPLAQKAVSLLRGHYVFVTMLRSTGFRGSWKVPEFVKDYGLVNTRTGARVLGFGKRTFEELKRARLLEAPARFPSRYAELRRKRRGWGKPYTEDVYTLNADGLTAVVIALLIRAADLREEVWS